MSSLKNFLNPYSPYEPDIVLSPENAEAMRNACVSTSTKVIQHLDSQFGDFDTHMNRQIEAIETLASDAHKQSLSAEQQADAANRQALVLERQLAFVKLEAESAKKDAKFSKLMAVLALFVSVCAIIAPLLYG